MKRTTTPLSLLCAASVMFVSACAGGDGAESDSAADSTHSPTPSSSAVATADSAKPTTTAAPGALLDPNSATREQLTAVPGLEAATADTLIARRPFQTMLAVDSILAKAKLTEAQRDTVYTRMFKPLDLNSATKEEIMLIPGVGERMQHEFEEYRPYTNIAQFRREMLKYVKDTTVTRYEKYVTIK